MLLSQRTEIQDLVQRMNENVGIPELESCSL